VDKHVLPAKRSGVFAHQVLEPASPYLRGFSDEVDVPVSRWTEIRAADLPAAGLKVLMASDEAGPCLVEDAARRSLHMFNHLEYDAATLAEEFDRDRARDPSTPLPHGYFPGDDPARAPANRWRSHAHLLFANWINQIYQTTPFDPAAIGEDAAEG